MPTREVAVANACPLLAIHPYDIWIESPLGKRIDADEIAKECEVWGPFDQAADQPGNGSLQPGESEPVGYLPPPQGVATDRSVDAPLTAAKLEQEVALLLNWAKAVTDIPTRKRLHRRAYELTRLAHLAKAKSKPTAERPHADHREPGVDCAPKSCD